LTQRNCAKRKKGEKECTCLCLCVCVSVCVRERREREGMIVCLGQRVQYNKTRESVNAYSSTAT